MPQRRQRKPNAGSKSGNALRRKAERLARDYAGGELAVTARVQAESQFRQWLQGAGLGVREVLAQKLSAAADVPRDVIMALVGDVDTVATPVLEGSTILREDDLIEVLRVSHAEKQKAIARRKSLSRRLSAALIESGDRDVIVTLIGNHSAEIPEAAYLRLFEKLSLDDRLRQAIRARNGLPAAVLTEMRQAETTPAAP